MKEKIKFDTRNYRIHDERNKDLIRKSLNECGAGRSILLDADDEIIAGNGVYEQAKELGMPVKVIETDGSELVVVKRTDLKTKDEKRKKLAVLDNSTSDSSQFDFGLLQEDFSKNEISEMGIEIPDVESNFKDEEDSKYTRKISLPIYEIRGENPKIEDMINTEKADKFKKEIEKSDIPEDIKEFLIKCCTRLYEFDYGKIAEYYAYQDKKVQSLMEKIALVLIDLNSAVENGYVELNQFIENCFLEDKENDDGE